MKKLAFGTVALTLVLGIVGAQCGTTPRPTPSPTTRPTTAPTRPVPPTPTPTPRPPTFINLNLGAEPPTIDPALATDTTSIQCDELLFLGLTDYDDETVEVIPELAEKWEVSGDGLTWTFHLRRDVYWVRYDQAAGMVEKKRPVTAHDVEYGVKRALDPATDSGYAYVLYAIRGAEAFNTQPVTAPVSADTVGVRALDDYTVEFETVTPAVYFPGIAGMWFARPVPREIVEAHGDAWTEPEHIWINGPYLLDTWDHEEKMVMVKNPAYPAAANVQIDQVNWFMVDTSKAMAMYENGELDVTTPPAIDPNRHRLPGSDPVLIKELHTAPVPCTYFCAFNTTEAPVDNVHVRRALSYAVDRQTICDAVLGNGQRPAKTFAPPGVFGSPAEDPDFEGISFDPEMARRELALAGYPGGASLPKITLVFATSEHHDKIAQAIQANWKEHLGIEVELMSLFYYTSLHNFTAQIFRGGWCADYPDENNWVLELFHSTRGYSVWPNYTKWSNAEFDRLVEQAAAEMDPARRKELYFKAEKILCVDEAVIIPIYYYTHVVLTKGYVTRTYAPLGGEHVDRWTVQRP